MVRNNLKDVHAAGRVLIWSCHGVTQECKKENRGGKKNIGKSKFQSSKN